MKKYVVCKGYKMFSPDVVESFDNAEDAQQFAELMKKTHPNTEYVVYEKIEFKLDGVYERKYNDNKDLIQFT